jgi:hypothetical protein
MTGLWVGIDAGWLRFMHQRREDRPLQRALFGNLQPFSSPLVGQLITAAV